jgi:hypothetical protein
MGSTSVKLDIINGHYINKTCVFCAHLEHNSVFIGEVVPVHGIKACGGGGGVALYLHSLLT